MKEQVRLNRFFHASSIYQQRTSACQADAKLQAQLHAKGLSSLSVSASSALSCMHADNFVAIRLVCRTHY